MHIFVLLNLSQFNGLMSKTIAPKLTGTDYFHDPFKGLMVNNCKRKHPPISTVSNSWRIKQSLMEKHPKSKDGVPVRSLVMSLVTPYWPVTVCTAHIAFPVSLDAFSYLWRLLCYPQYIFTVTISRSAPSLPPICDFCIFVRSQKEWQKAGGHAIPVISVKWSVHMV